jgi:aryl-alcohol dehydrogenase-like predicted oxidoreductase
VEIEEIVGTMSDLVKQGKIKHIGLSEVNAQRYVGHMQFTLFQPFKPNILYGVVNQNKRFLMFVKNLVSPLLHTVLWEEGFLTGAIKSRADLEQGDFRLGNPRFTDEAIKRI